MSNRAPWVAELRWLHDAAERLADPLGGHLVDVALDLLATRFGSALSTYNALSAEGAPLVEVAPQGGLSAELVADVRARLSEHPFFESVTERTAPCGPVLRVSDVATRRAWLDSRFYQELIAPHDVPRFPLFVPLRAGSDPRWYMLNRDEEFSEVERDLAGRLQPVLVALHRRAAPVSAVRVLTRRELDVVQQVADGRTVAAAARRLGIAEGTARKHLENVHRKLGTNGVVATLRRARALGLLADDA